MYDCSGCSVCESKTMIDKNSFPVRCANGTRRAAREQYLEFLRAQDTEYDYDVILKNTKQALMDEDGADEDTAQVVAVECVERLKSSAASIRAKRSLLEGLLSESPSNTPR